MRNYIERLGLTIGIVGLFWLARMLIIISWGYRYIAYENNIYILYAEIVSMIIGMIILLVMLIDKF